MESAAMAVATAVVMMAENGGDGGGIEAATAAGTDTDNNQLKAAAEGRWRWWWQQGKDYGQRRETAVGTTEVKATMTTAAMVTATVGGTDNNQLKRQ